MLSPNAYQISLENLDVLFVQTMDSRTEPIYFSPLYVVKEGEKKKKQMGKEKEAPTFLITCGEPILETKGPLSMMKQTAKL